MEELLKALRDHVGDPQADFPKMLDLKTGKFRYVWNATYRKKNAKGEWMKKTFEMPVTMKYNPFTGEEFEK